MIGLSGVPWIDQDSASQLTRGSGAGQSVGSEPLSRTEQAAGNFFYRA